MDLEHGNKDSKLPGNVIDESWEIKQSEAPAKVNDGNGEIKQLETPLIDLDGHEESKQSKTLPKVSNGSESKHFETTANLHDGVEESKQSETTPEVSDGRGENKQPETFTKVYDGMPSPPLQSKVAEATAKRSHQHAPSETHQEVGDGSGRSKHPSSPAFPSKGDHRRAPSVPKANGGGSKHPSSPAFPSKFVEAGTAKGGHMRNPSEASTVKGAHSHKPSEASTAKGTHTRNPSDTLLSFTSTSSSGSDTSMDDLFQVDSTRFSSSSQIPPLPNSPYRPSTSHRSNATPTETPPGIQTIDRYGGYDPYRIPSSVFDTSNLSNKDMEWSVASNESLFSLHLGNNSFSRDHIVTISGELTPTKSPELFGISTPRTPPPVVAREIHRIEEGRESAGEEMADENINNSGRASAESQNRSEGMRVSPPIVSSPKAPSLAPSLAPSHRSDGSGISGASAKSFAFPILADGMENSLKLAQDSEEQLPEVLPIGTAKKQKKKKKTRWFPCFSWCCCCCKWSWGCSCFSWCSCHRICCCWLCCSCPRCFRRLCFCF